MKDNKEEPSFDYNTSREQLIQREYGRNIQKLVKYVKNIEDRKARTKYAYTLVELMKQINPIMKESAEYNQKVWDDLYIISQFELDVDVPFKMPEKGARGKRPKRMDYNTSEIKIKHYGRNIEILIDKAKKLEGEERKAAIVQIGKLMKGFYNTWNKDNIDDSVILKNIEGLSGGQLTHDLDTIKSDSLFDSNSRRSSGSGSGPSSNGNGKYSGRKSYSSNKRRKS